MGDLRAALLQEVVRRVTDVPVGEQTFYVREMSMATFRTFKDKLKENERDANALLLEDCVCTSDGEKILSPEDAYVVADSLRVAPKLLEAVVTLSGANIKEDGAEKKADAGGTV